MLYLILFLFLFGNNFLIIFCDLGCLKTVDLSVYPSCKIVGSPESFECLTQWDNSLFLAKDGNMMLDCVADYPLDFDFDGVIPIKNFHMKYYKSVDKEVNWKTGPILKYGIQVEIHQKKLEYSGNYIFRSLKNPNISVSIYVFTERKELPQFLDIKKEGKKIEAYIDEEENALVIPCRSANYNATIGVFLNHGEITKEVDGVNFRYDPRYGFIRKILPRNSAEYDEVEMYGEYECFADWKGSARDRMKIFAKQPPSKKQRDEVVTSGEDNADVIPPTPLSDELKEEIVELNGIITFNPVGKNLKASCTPPQIKDHTPFFANAYMENPTSAHINKQCAHLDSSCGDHVRILGNHTENNKLEIGEIFPAGLLQCMVSNNKQTIEYFTGTDEKIYNDWNVALNEKAIVKLIPKESYERYVPNKKFEFTCKYPGYIGVEPVYWNLKFKNGTHLQELDSNVKSYTLDLDVNEVECGVTLWNSSVWYKSLLALDVIDFEAPPLVSKDQVVNFRANEANQALRCEIEPGSQAKLEWIQNGKKIDDIPSLDLGTSLVLFFERINSTYEGNYTCRASTKSGNAEAIFTIKLDGESTEGKDGQHANCNIKTHSVAVKDINGLHDIESVTSIGKDDVFILNFESNSCNSNDNRTVLVKILQTDVDLKNPIIIPKSEAYPESLSENYYHSNGDAEGVWLKRSILLPLILGLSLVLLILVIAYGSYSYFVTPWKIGNISTVSSGPLI